MFMFSRSVCVYTPEAAIAGLEQSQPPVLVWCEGINCELQTFCTSTGVQYKHYPSVAP